MQKLTCFVLTAFVAGLLLSACDSGGPTLNGSDSTVEQLVGYRWQLQALQSSRGDDTALNDGETYTVSFGQNERLGGQADCNSYFATYDAEDGGSLAVDSLGTTYVYCGEESNDEIYMKGISTADKYEIKGDRLRIGFEQEGVLTFRRMNPDEK